MYGRRTDYGFFQKYNERDPYGTPASSPRSAGGRPFELSWPARAFNRMGSSVLPVHKTTPHVLALVTTPWGCCLYACVREVKRCAYCDIRF